MNTQSTQRLLQEVCRVAGTDQALVTKITLLPDEHDPVDILLTLMDGSTRRVELSALPAEIFGPQTDQMTRPIPEHTTLTDPAPVKLEAGPPRKRGRKK